MKRPSSADCAAEATRQKACNLCGCGYTSRHKNSRFCSKTCAGVVGSMNRPRSIIPAEITADVCRELFSYSPDDGHLRWRARPGLKRRYIDAPAGAVSANGYQVISLAGKQYKAHRLVWLYVHGEWPGLVDHINGVRSDNRLSNLRLATFSQNLFNTRAHIDGAIGVKGVFYFKADKIWCSSIQAHGKRVYLGRFKTMEEAAAAYAEAASVLHGEFARVT